VPAVETRLEATSQKDERVAKGLALLGRSGPLLIACGRFVPGVRFAVNVSMGLIEYPYRRFLLFSAIGGVLWASYTCLLAYWIGTSLADFPLASILISGIVTTVLSPSSTSSTAAARAGPSQRRLGTPRPAGPGP
jgi:membrane-associated protein